MDRALRAIAMRRAELDADEARWLREAEAIQIWRPLGMVSALDYLERVLGYGHASPRSGCGSRGHSRSLRSRTLRSALHWKHWGRTRRSNG